MYDVVKQCKSDTQTLYQRIYVSALNIGTHRTPQLPGHYHSHFGNTMMPNPIKLDSWDPFGSGGVIVPEGFTYIGKLSFICFGPTSKFFASTLAMGGQLNRTVEKKGMFKEGSA